MSHHILIAYSMGASKEKLLKIFETHAKEQLPLPPPITIITRQNYKQHLGESKAYTSYLAFFQKEIDQYGMMNSIRRWIWQGDFLARTIAGTWHPVIHIGFGIEFQLPGMVAEGLAMTACTKATYSRLIPDLQPSWSSWLFNWIGPKPIEPLCVDSIPDCLQDSQIFRIFAHIRQNSAFDGLLSFTDKRKLGIVLNNKPAMDQVKWYVQQWPIQETEQDIQHKFKDLYLISTLALGTTGIRHEQIKMDFFFMHGVTSVELIHQYLAKIKPREAVCLLHAQLSALILMYLFRNRPYFDLEALLSYRSPLDSCKNNNPWLDVLEKSLDCEVHVIKVVRSCAVGQMLCGSSHDARLHDIWLKVAKMSIDNQGCWEQRGVGFDEIWGKS
ncbi:hypothetical protein G6F56_000695 [Rhizopus delemar]|nr:hypothetical protein G6F56_000695 [Rhizopus delemar]